MKNILAGYFSSRFFGCVLEIDADGSGAMNTLTTAERKKGFQAMRDRMSADAAARVRRSLKAGRPARMLNETVPVLDAVVRLTDEADKARSAMCKEGLD